MRATDVLPQLNHPALSEDREFIARLGRAAVNKPSNANVYTGALQRAQMDVDALVADPDFRIGQP